MFVTIFLGIYENPRRKNFIKPSCPKDSYFSYFFVAPWKGFMETEALHKTFLRYQKEVHENKAFMSFYPLFGIGATKVKTVFLSNSGLDAISVSLTTDIHKNRPWNIKTKLVC